MVVAMAYSVHSGFTPCITSNPILSGAKSYMDHRYGSPLRCHSTRPRIQTEMSWWGSCMVQRAGRRPPLFVICHTRYQEGMEQVPSELEIVAAVTRTQGLSTSQPQTQSKG